MTLVEIMVVIVLLGVVLGAVLLLLSRGTSEYHFARRQNELDIAGRLALDAMTDAMIWAGYMPEGGWDDDEWHPVVIADTSQFVFYADFEPYRSLDTTDYRSITLLPEGNIRIANGDLSWSRTAGESITDLDFEYLDASGNSLGSSLGTEELRDQVRHIQIRIELTSMYGNDAYQRVMQTTVSPRNLGLSHDFDPNFYQPPQLDGNIVFNVSGQDSVPAPDVHEDAMVDRLSFWGYTVTMLTDAQLTGYDYTDVNMLILRHMGGDSVHSNQAFFQNLNVPIVTMNAAEAVNTFNLGTTHGTWLNMRNMSVEIEEHHVNQYLPTTGTFYVYDSLGSQSVVSGFSPGVDFITAINTSDSSGVCAVDSVETKVRVHYSPWMGNFYSDDGWQLFYNVITWASYNPGETPGEPLTEEEDFEQPQPEEVEMTLWQDDIEPELVDDTVTVWMEDFTNLTLDGTWDFIPGPVYGRCGVITEGSERFLRMDRSIGGGPGDDVRNLALWTTDLAGYDATVDDLVFRADCQRGWFEGLEVEDGVFFWSDTIGRDTLLTQDFESLLAGHGDINYWGDLYGQYRVHSPAGWQGNGNFVTFDSRVDGEYARNRMMLEVSTTGYQTGDEINVDFRFHDHSDDNHTSYGYADFLGWNATGRIDDDYTNVAYLSPYSYSDYEWHDRSASFTPGVLPDPIYILFGQYGSRSAVNFWSTDGISLDDIVVSVNAEDTTLTRIAPPPTGPAVTWTPMAFDLDSAARAAGVTFDSDFQLVLSQMDSGNWTQRGRCWDNVEIAEIEQTLTDPDWEHGPLESNSQGYTGVDDWGIDSVSTGTDYFWGLGPDGYEDSTYCYLMSPSIAIPSSASDVDLSFTHRYLTTDNNSGGWVEMSVDGGVSWAPLSLGYNGTAGGEHPADPGTQIFYGASGDWILENVDLSSYAGQTVQLRFVFGANQASSVGYWDIDSFSLEAEVTAWVIESLEFEATTGNWGWTFDDIDIYMAATSDSVFDGAGGQWNPDSMVNVLSDASLTVNSSGWYELTLDQTFILPQGQNLAIKVRKFDTYGSTTVDRWGHLQTAQYQSRYGYSDTGWPTGLVRSTYQPVMKLNCTTGTIGTIDSQYNYNHSPLRSNYEFSDWEAIYMGTQLGGTEETEWTSGGDGDDWEIGSPDFVPDVDPWLEPGNGTGIAGNDLTDDGYYEDDAWAWFISPAYDFPDTIPVTATLVFDRCVRLAPGDVGFVFLGFGDTNYPPTSESDWVLVRTYNSNHTYWDNEQIDITSEFLDAAGYDPNFFWLRFVLSSNMSGVRGGWNLDNVQVFGDDE